MKTSLKHLMLSSFCILLACVVYTSSSASTPANSTHGFPIQHFLTKKMTSRTLGSTKVTAPLFSFFQFDPATFGGAYTYTKTTGGSGSGGGGGGNANPYFINNTGSTIFAYISAGPTLTSSTQACIIYPSHSKGTSYAEIPSCSSPTALTSSYTLFVATKQKLDSQTDYQNHSQLTKQCSSKGVAATYNSQFDTYTIYIGSGNPTITFYASSTCSIS